MKRVVAVYCLLVGLSMLLLWAGLLIGGKVPELRSDPADLICHLVAEIATALTLIVAGLGALADGRWAASLRLVALGMLLYATINSLGYYVGRPEGTPFVVLFGSLIVATLAVLVCYRDKVRA